MKLGYGGGAGVGKEFVIVYNTSCYKRFLYLSRHAIAARNEPNKA